MHFYKDLPISHQSDFNLTIFCPLFRILQLPDFDVAVSGCPLAGFIAGDDTVKVAFPVALSNTTFCVQLFMLSARPGEFTLLALKKPEPGVVNGGEV